jgi:hypothetical protein
METSNLAILDVRYMGEAQILGMGGTPFKGIIFHPKSKCPIHHASFKIDLWQSLGPKILHIPELFRLVFE